MVYQAYIAVFNLYVIVYKKHTIAFCNICIYFFSQSEYS